MTKNNIIFLFKIANYYINISSSEITRKVKNCEKLEYSSISFIWKNDEYVAILDNVEYSSIYDIVKIDDDDLFCKSSYLDEYFDIDFIINNSDFENLMKIIKIQNGCFYLYNKETNNFKRNDFYDLDIIIKLKVPFRYTYIHKFKDDKVIYCNNINGEYKLFSPADFITDDDIKNIDIYSILINT